MGIFDLYENQKVERQQAEQIELLKDLINSINYQNKLNEKNNELLNNILVELEEINKNTKL